VSDDLGACVVVLGFLALLVIVVIAGILAGLYVFAVGLDLVP
jgi:hypothetical protein